MIRIQGTFLTSRVGRRIFWTLLLAAAVPIALFGAASNALLTDQFRAQAMRQQAQLVKFAGMDLLDRLLAARTALDRVSRSGEITPNLLSTSRHGRMLVDAAMVDEHGRLLLGAGSLVDRWRAHLPAASGVSDHDTATLVVPTGDSGPDQPVLMVLHRADRPGNVWMAEINPVFLFSELASDVDGALICVFASTGRALFCPSPEAWSPEAAANTRNDAVRWNLFLRADFGVDDWSLRLEVPTVLDTSAEPLTRMVGLGALATLLIVGMLSLIQVRRTLVPLERLISGTRRLAERDYAVRVAVEPGDEFGQLAQSFNHMAERIGSQVQALHVQSAIDREILSGLNVARALQRVAQRLEQLAPGACAAVLEFDRNSSTLARVHTTVAAMTAVEVPPAEIARIAQRLDSGDLLCEATPAWLGHALRRPTTRAWMQPARRDDELLGLLVVASSDEVSVAHGAREIAELGDRVSVMLTSAERERRLVERATHDGLTGLLNRDGLYEALQHLLVDGKPSTFTVMFIDLDRFKDVNDSMGHQAGDELLNTLARRLQQHVPAGTALARHGGDEFVLIVPGTRSVADVLATRLCGELARPVTLGDRTVVVGASIGMARCPEHGDTSSDLLRRADMAMYSAKTRGGGVTAWFEPSLDARVAERAALRSDLQEALQRGQFALHYQPRVDPLNGKTVGAEALLRWLHPLRGAVHVPTFIELLEESGHINEVGLWVIEQAAGQLALWRARGMRMASVAVNVSTRQLHAPDLPERVVEVLARHGLRPENLELEVTESIFMGDSTVAIAALRRLRDSGVRIALDDFGTGYSSLSYLHTLPVSVLKVDRSFVSELGRCERATALTRSIIALARALDMRVVAEGVESQQQADLLIQLKCDELQGYLYSRPLAPAAFEAFAMESPRTLLEEVR